jgi:stearoyl-CoA desaturase (delta-9 desaturase)
MVVLVFFISHWYLSLFAQTFFHHRYASHGAFTMSRFWERVFFIFSFIMQGSTYMSPKTYGIMHRLHHAHTDTIKDPHSPAFSSNIFSMMLRTSKIYLRIMDGLWKVDERYTKNLPEWKWMDDLGNAKWTRIAWGLAYITFYAFFATSAWMYLLLPVHILMGAFHGAIINWFAHKYGYRNFRLKNLSKNLFTIDVLMLGESYHNNHHKRPSSVNFGVRWHEIDPVYPVIWLLDRLRVIRIVKQPAMAAS